MKYLMLLAALAVVDRRWVTTASMPAAEAHQAAAVDARFVYVVSSTVVAKYDRATKERVAVSTGEARHLNSAFVHGGRVYCAHSNYPKTPESSQVMVLDPETMKLSVHKDFGNYGGSLTWVVRRGDEKGWWCNFARYDKENAKTFLVRFDEEWNEVARYSYPPELFKELGKYSLSGGVWRGGDALCVTGHDERVLYRLRLPKEGGVLEMVGREGVPFAGQGIAVDPVTGGLVGIDRGKRVVVFAEEK